MANQIRFMRQLLYSLKREYGFNCTFQRVVQNQKDYISGIRSATPASYTINRVIRLPDEMSRLTNLDFLFGKFSMGAKVEQHNRFFIVDAKSLPVGYFPQIEDIILLGKSTYRIIEVEEMDYQIGYFIKGQENK